MFNDDILVSHRRFSSPASQITIFRLPAVKTESGYSRSTVYLRISQGLWTKQVSLGPRCVGWPAHEVAALNAARIAGKTDDEIRELVTRLEAARKQPIPMAKIASLSPPANLPARPTSKNAPQRFAQTTSPTVVAPIAANRRESTKAVPLKHVPPVSRERKS